VLVSILIPTLNRLPWLRLSLGSALRQRGLPIEVVVSDDGSTDGTRDYVAALARGDARVRLLTRNPTPGIFQNTSHLIAHARGDAYTVLGDDDLLDEDFCVLLAQPLENDQDVVLSFCDHRVIDEEGAFLPRATRLSSRRYGRANLMPGLVSDPLELALNGGVWLGFTLYRSSVFKSIPFDPAAGTAADWDFAIRAASMGKFYYVSGPHASYRDHGRTASRLMKPRASASALAVLQSRTFVNPIHESLRRGLMIDRAKRHAFQFASSDVVMARRSLELYRSLGGSGLSTHVYLARMMLALPRPVARVVYEFVSSAADALRRATRRLFP
jgi:glycosyltransferase involved in cell wall biosynthesis